MADGSTPSCSLEASMTTWAGASIRTPPAPPTPMPPASRLPIAPPAPRLPIATPLLPLRRIGVFAGDEVTPK